MAGNAARVAVECGGDAEIQPGNRKIVASCSKTRRTSSELAPRSALALTTGAAIIENGKITKPLRKNECQMFRRDPILPLLLQSWPPSCTGGVRQAHAEDVAQLLKRRFPERSGSSCHSFECGTLQTRPDQLRVSLALLTRVSRDKAE